MQNHDFHLLSAGRHHLPHELGLEQQLAGRVSRDTPILTCPMETDDFRFIENQRATSCFGYGSTKLGGIPVLTIRLQLGSTQIYWLADVTDAQVWKAMDKWHGSRRASHAFIVPTPGSQRAAFGQSPVAGSAPVIGQLRRHISAHAPADMWDMMTAIAASGLLQVQATTDIPHIRLERVLVNVLVTQRYQGMLEGRAFSQKPVVVTSSGAGVGAMH